MVLITVTRIWPILDGLDGHFVMGIIMRGYFAQTYCILIEYIANLWLIANLVPWCRVDIIRGMYIQFSSVFLDMLLITVDFLMSDSAPLPRPSILFYCCPASVNRFEEIWCVCGIRTWMFIKGNLHSQQNVCQWTICYKLSVYFQKCPLLNYI